MKKSICLLTLICALWSGAIADIQFVHDPWQEIVAQAARERKLVFLDAYTSWCGPCKWMAKTAFVDPEVSAFFNTHFVNAKIDMEQGEGVALAQAFEVKAFPTLLFVDGAGKLVHSAVGARSAADLLQLGRDVVAGHVVSIETMRQRYADGERDRIFLKDYILKLSELGQDFQAPIADFEPYMAGDGLLAPDCWAVFEAVARRTNSPRACFFLSHLPEFEAKFGARDVQYKAMAFFTTRVCEAAAIHDRDSFDLTCKAIVQAGWQRTDSILALMDMIYRQVAEEWKAFPKATQRYLSMVQKPDPEFLNQIAWACYEHVDRKADLKLALQWAEQSVAGDPNSANLDTQAQLLKKLGRYREAIPIAQESIRLGKEAGEDVSSTEEALREMQK